MTVDLTHLRRLVEECRDAHAWKRQPDGSMTCSLADAEDVALRLGTRANDILEVLDRLERAEKKLAERDSVYPTLMTQVGKKKT